MKEIEPEKILLKIVEQKTFFSRFVLFENAPSGRSESILIKISWRYEECEIVGNQLDKFDLISCRKFSDFALV